MKKITNYAVYLVLNERQIANITEKTKKKINKLKIIMNKAYKLIMKLTTIILQQSGGMGMNEHRGEESLTK